MSVPMLLTNPGRRDVVPDAGFGALGRAPLRTHQALDGYAPTPLRSLPALAERPEDIPVLTRFFVEKYAGVVGRRVLGVTTDALNFVRQDTKHPLQTLKRPRTQDQVIGPHQRVQGVTSSINIMQSGGA